MTPSKAHLWLFPTLHEKDIRREIKENYKAIADRYRPDEQFIVYDLNSFLDNHMANNSLDPTSPQWRTEVKKLLKSSSFAETMGYHYNKVYIFRSVHWTNQDSEILEVLAEKFGAEKYNGFDQNQNEQDPSSER
jgi:hypothetical protein